MTRLVLVGEAPGGSKPAEALLPSGYTGQRLCGMLGLEPDEYVKNVDRRNLFTTPQELPWDTNKAALSASAIIATLPVMTANTRLVCLGVRVAAAFGIEHYPLFTWERSGNVFGPYFWIARVPHPSGRNRLLNDEKVRQHMITFLREAYWDD